KLSLSDFPGAYRQFSELVIDHLSPYHMSDPASKRIQDALLSISGDSLIRTAYQKVLAETCATLHARSWVLINQMAAGNRTILYIPIDSGVPPNYLANSVPELG